MSRYNYGTESVLRGFNKKGKYVKFYVEDKVSVQVKDKAISGIIKNIGTKYLYVQTGSRILYYPRADGRSWEIPTKKIELKDVVRISKYPEVSQRYSDIKLRGVR